MKFTTGKFSAGLAKLIGSIMTIAFSLVAFAYGQNCQLLPGWSPSTLADGQSKTGYMISEATYTQSCTGSAGRITCISGSVANGNVYKYASCIPHTRANCTTPTGANHLEYRTLYKTNHNTYTDSCQQLSQNLQCLNGVFTGGITPGLYTFATCTDQNRAQCVDIRTNGYKDHGETIIGYTASSPSLGQTCFTLQKNLTCINGTWSGGSQSSLFTGCTNPASFSGCNNIRTNTIIPHNGIINGYTAPTGVCTTLSRSLTCINGIRSGNGSAQQNGLYSGCIQAGSCQLSTIGMTGGTIESGDHITKYSHQFAFESNGESCANFAVTMECSNGQWIGGPALYTSCQTIASGSCLNIRTNQYIPNTQYIYGYTSSTPASTLGCESVKVSLRCMNGLWQNTLGTTANQNTLYGSCGSCILPRSGAILQEGASTGAYSVTSTNLPQKCSNFRTILSCSGGLINGNRQTYQYPSCADEAITPGIDIAINGSQGLSATSNLVAQGSNPEVSILFENKGDTSLLRSNLGAGFLECVRKEQQNLNIYKSNVISSFVVNSGTKVGVNIRLKSIFSQALGQKTIVCTIDPTVQNGYTDADPSNNTRSGTIEVVEANRFDLALSRSIEPISKNLDAAEGAIGTQGLQNFLFDKIMNVLVPLIIVIGILSALLGFYKIMFSSDDKAVQEGTRYITFGVIGIIIIMSAKFIGQNVYSILTPQSGDIKGFEIASQLYNNIIYPFLKFAIYLVLGAMFVILLSRVITFVFGSDSDAQKKAGTLIGWNVISMLVIIAAKQIVEAVYGKQGDVVKDITNLGEVGSGVLADKNIPILYQVINYALGLAAFVILVLIIIQTVKLLTKPDDPAQIKSIKNSLLYMFLGILILGAGYLIVNFAILN